MDYHFFYYICYAISKFLLVSFLKASSWSCTWGFFIESFCLQYQLVSNFIKIILLFVTFVIIKVHTIAETN